MRIAYRATLYLSLSMLLAGIPAASRAASYLPLSDADLARRAPVIVRAQVLSQKTLLESREGQPLACTLTTFQVLEALKGHVSSDTIRVELPGGEIAGVRTALPGIPDFSRSDEVLLFLAPSQWQGADFGLTELGLSHFDIVEDMRHRRFAVRPAFRIEEDDVLSQREETGRSASAAAARRLRDADSLLSFLRSTPGENDVAIQYASPIGELRSVGRRIRPLWVNIGGVEGAASSLFRWFWDTGRSPIGNVSVSGTQSNLSDGSNGTAYVQNAVNSWRNVAASDVRYNFVGSGGNVVVNLDVDNQGDAWQTPLACGTGGVLGLGGPGSSPAAGNFKGDGPFFAIPTGTVWMRRITGNPGCYSATTFASGVLHELGHTLGLGHPDQKASIHSAICPFEPCAAVMRSTLTGATTPQPDDLAAIQWYYGTAVEGPVPRAGVIHLTRTRPPGSTAPR